MRIGGSGTDHCRSKLRDCIRSRPSYPTAQYQSGTRTTPRPGLTWQPFVATPAADRDRSVLAVVHAAKIEVVHHSTVGRKHLVEPPPLIAGSCPDVEVLRHAAKKDLAVDGA